MHDQTKTQLEDLVLLSLFSVEVDKTEKHPEKHGIENIYTLKCKNYYTVGHKIKL